MTALDIVPRHIRALRDAARYGWLEPRGDGRIAWKAPDNSALHETRYVDDLVEAGLLARRLTVRHGAVCILTDAGWAAIPRDLQARIGARADAPPEARRTSGVEAEGRPGLKQGGKP